MYNAKKAYASQGHSGLEHASKYTLVLASLNEVISCIDEAKGAMMRSDIATKSKKISKAVNILTEALIPGINLEEGGEIAQNLQSIYAFAATELMQANAKNDPKLLDNARTAIEPIRAAWQELPQHTKV